MKKRISLLLALILTAALFASCGGNTNQGQDTPPAPSQSAGPTGEQSDAVETEGQDYTIGLVQITEHLSLDTIRDSFLDEMSAQGYGHVNFEYHSAQGEMSNLNTIMQTYVGNEVDLIVAIATPTAQSAAAATEGTGIPVVFSAVTDPVGARLVDDLDKPDGNITGVSDAIPVELIFGLAAELTPEAKTFGFVYNLGEDNSVSVINDAKAYCDANGLSYIEATVANTSEVQQAAQSLVGRVDAFFTPIDNTVADAMPVYAKVAMDAGLPIYPGADSMVEEGGFATFGIDYELLGKETARMAIEILTGASPSDLPVVTMTDFRAIANQATADAIGVDINGVEHLEIISGQ